MGRMEVSAHLVGPQELEEVVLHVGMVRSAMDSNLDNWVAVNKDLRIQNPTLSKKSLAVLSSTVSGNDNALNARTVLQVEIMADGAPNEKVFPGCHGGQAIPTTHGNGASEPVVLRLQQP